MDKYVVVGNPIAHSKSPSIHAQFAQSTKQDMSYDLMLGDLERFESQIKDFFEQGGKGYPDNRSSKPARQFHVLIFIFLA